jgi:hypothetical protein
MGAVTAEVACASRRYASISRRVSFEPLRVDPKSETLPNRFEKCRLNPAVRCRADAQNSMCRQTRGDPGEPRTPVRFILPSFGRRSAPRRSCAAIRQTAIGRKTNQAPWRQILRRSVARDGHRGRNDLRRNSVNLGEGCPKHFMSADYLCVSLVLECRGRPCP